MDLCFNVWGKKEKWTSSPLSVLCIPHKITLCFQTHGIGSLPMHTLRGKRIRQLIFPAVIFLFLFVCWCIGSKNKGDMGHFSQRKGLWMTEIMRSTNLDDPTYYELKILTNKCLAVVPHGQWDLTLQQEVLYSSIERIPWMLFGCSVSLVVKDHVYYHSILCPLI